MIDPSAVPEPPRSQVSFAVKVLLAAVVIVVPVLVYLRLMRQPVPASMAARPVSPPEPLTPVPPPTPQAQAQPTMIPLSQSVDPEEEAIPVDVQAAELLAYVQAFAPEKIIKTTAAQRRVVKIALAAIIVSMPLLMLFGLLHFSVPNATLDDYIPYWSDDVYYWRQAVSFATVGFDGGYFTFLEQPAQVGRFYSWGMFDPIFMGSFGRLFGLGLAFIPLFGAVLLGLALAVFIRVARLDIERLLWLLLVLVSFTALWIFHISSYLEESLYVLTVLIVASFYLLIKARRPTLWQAAFALLAVLVATLLRPSMGLFFVPLFILLQRRNSVITIGLALVVGSVVGLAVGSVVSLTISPRSYNPSNDILRVWRTDFQGAWQLVTQNVVTNLQYFSEGEAPQLFERAQVVVAMVALAVAFVLSLWRRTRRFSLGIPAAELLLYLYALVPIVVLYNALYDIRDWRDFRGMAPHLLFVVLLMVAQRRRIWLAAFVISGLLFLPQANATYTSWAQAYVVPGQRAAFDDLRDKLAAVVSYQPDAPSPWCNTVLHTTDFFKVPATLIALPPQIAVSFTFGIPEVPDPPQSHYLLIDPGNYVNYADRFTHLQLLLDVPGGALYLNPDSACRPENLPPS